MSARTMFCGQCGARNPEVNRFCLECGARLEACSGNAGVLEPAIEWPDDLPKVASGADGAKLLLVPGGLFPMGSQKLKKDERPRRLVWLDSYYIDELPVTNERYAEWLEKTGHSAPPGFRRGDERWASLPVVRVTWEEASAYARWAQRRLPTEAEWEKAARGIDGRTWPWGDEDPTGSAPPRASFGDEDGTPTPAGAFPQGASPYGALDMAGNVWEWCQDRYDQAFYPRCEVRNPRCDDGDPLYRVLRGGACTYSAQVIRAAFRGWNLPHMRSPVFGFRCAADPARFRTGEPA